MRDKVILEHIKLVQYKKPSVSQNWIKWLNDKDVTKYSDQRFIKHTLNSQKKYIQTLMQNNTIFYKIFYKDEEIGNIFLTRIDKNNKNCEIGYLIGEKKLWGKGIATYVVGIVVDYAFKTLKLKKIYSWCYENNIGSKKALMKNSFRIEGNIKKFYQFNKTKRVNKIYLGLLG